MAYTAKDPHPPPPRRFLYLIKTKSWRCEGGRGEGEGEKVSLLTHTTAWAVGKNMLEKKNHQVYGPASFQDLDLIEVMEQEE